MARAPEATAPSTEARPTPPRPTTATVVPARTCAVLTTAPTPVSTAQPKSAASSSGRSFGSTFTAERRETTAYSANAEQPMWWFTGLPSPLKMRRSPESSVPAVFETTPGSHSAGPPFGARQAVAAARHEDEHDVVALLEVVHAGAELPRRRRRPRGPAPSAWDAGDRR